MVQHRICQYDLWTDELITADSPSDPADIEVTAKTIIWVRVKEVHGTNPTLDIKVQISPDDVDYADMVLAFPTITKAGLYFLHCETCSKYLKLYAEVGGIDPEFLVDAFIQGKT